jgi:uncharacterized protein
VTVSYFDTSALLKLLIDEDGSDEAGALWGGADVVAVGRLTYPETRAALAAAERDGRISAHGHRATVRALEDLWSSLEIVEVAPAIANEAGELAATHALRGYDAVHLATALAATGGVGVLVTWDRRLADAALAEGLAIAPPLSN